MQLKTVFDSNVYVAASLKPGGYAAMRLDIAALPYSGLNPYLSNLILSEIREKLVQTFGLPVQEVEGFISRLRQIATMVYPKEKIDDVKDDPDDDILECAVTANAQLIISADHLY